MILTGRAFKSGERDASATVYPGAVRVSGLLWEKGYAPPISSMMPRSMPIAIASNVHLALRESAETAQI